MRAALLALDIRAARLSLPDAIRDSPRARGFRSGGSRSSARVLALHTPINERVVQVRLPSRWRNERSLQARGESSPSRSMVGDDARRSAASTTRVIVSAFEIMSLAFGGESRSLPGLW